MLTANFNHSLTVLTAKTGPSGAQAAITKAATGVEATHPPSRRYSVDDLFHSQARVRQAEWRDALRHKADVLTGRDVSNRSDKLSQASLARLKKRMIDMSKALETLSGPAPASQSKAGNMILRLVTGDGDDALALRSNGLIENVHTNSGQDAVSLQAAELRFLYTGDGADAVTLKADRVAYVHTDLEKNSTGTGGNLFKSYANDDAVAIAATSVQGIGTGGGDDAITIDAALIEWVNGGDGDDSMTINGGMLYRIDGGRGNDTIAVRATIGDGIRQAVQWRASGGTPNAAYHRPQSVEARMALAAKSYADIRGQSGDDKINISVQEMIAVSGDEGDDLITVERGTVALRIGNGAGNDTVRLAKGAELVIRFDTQNPTYTVETIDNNMIINHSSGRITIENYQQGDAIGIAQGFRVATPQALTSSAAAQTAPVTPQALAATQLAEVNGAAAFHLPELDLLHLRNDLSLSKTA